MNLLAKADANLLTGIPSLFDAQASTAPPILSAAPQTAALAGDNTKQLAVWLEKIRASLRPSIRPVSLPADVVDETTEGDTLETKAVREAGAFLQRLVAQVAAGNRVDALDDIFDTIDDLLLSGEIERVRWILRVASQHIDLADLPQSAFLSMIAITRPWSSVLVEERSELARRLRDRVARESGVEEAQRLLVGL